MNAALGGIERAEQSLTNSASRLAGSSKQGSNVDTASEMVSMDTAKNGLQASVTVAKVLSSTMGTLIDMFV